MFLKANLIVNLSGLIPRFDHGTFATLYEMGSYFKFPKFKDALIDMGTTSLNQLASSRLSGDRFKKSQIDEVLAGVKKAYAGSMYKQAALRSLYVAFFTQHYSKVREVRYFYQAIDPIPVFTKDMKESLGLSDEEWDNAKGDVKCDAKGGKRMSLDLHRICCCEANTDTETHTTPTTSCSTRATSMRRGSSKTASSGRCINISSTGSCSSRTRSSRFADTTLRSLSPDTTSAGNGTNLAVQATGCKTQAK
ncbi:hypothetical protein PG988_013807 [Apiospora saccharicola]